MVSSQCTATEMNRYVVQVRSFVWPAPEYTAWQKGPYRSRFLARVIARALRRDRAGLWREAEVVQVHSSHGKAGDRSEDVLRGESVLSHLLR